MALVVGPHTIIVEEITRGDRMGGKFPYCFMLTLTTQLDHPQYNPPMSAARMKMWSARHEMAAWCKEQFGEPFKNIQDSTHVWMTVGSDVFRFRHEKDAFAFKIRWA